MSDLNERIAARRGEMERQKQEDDAFRKRQEQQVLDTIAATLSDDEVRIRRDEDKLAMERLSPPAIDLKGVKRRELGMLLQRETRKRWTPIENWVVIGCIVSGVCLLHLAGFGLLPLGVGFWQRYRLNKKYRVQVKADHPHLFGDQP